MKWTILTLALAVPAAAFAQTAGQGQSPSSRAKVDVQQSQAYGPYLTDGQGRALYMFTADTKGASNCYDACANAWPPLKTASPPDAGPNVQQQKLGTIQRRDGTMQVTYDDMPLYYFARDQGSGSTTGQDVQGFGGEWYLVSPQGEKIEKRQGG